MVIQTDSGYGCSLGLACPSSRLFYSALTNITMDITTIIKIVWAASAVGLTALVLLHSPKGDGLGALGGQAQLFTSTKSAETTLNRATWVLTVLFMGLTVVISGGWLNTPPTP
jgi:preprotein translocase subunit SecG